MKSAEEWSKEYNLRYSMLDEEADKVVGEGIVPTEHIHEIIIKQIQLDAMKEGARRAATVVVENNQPVFDLPTRYHTRQALGQAVLTAAEQWTEKDL